VFSNCKVSGLLMTSKIPPADASVWFSSVILKGDTYRSENQNALKYRMYYVT